MGRMVGLAAAWTVVARVVAAAERASPGTKGRMGWSGVAKAGDDEKGTEDDASVAAAPDGVLLTSSRLLLAPKSVSASGFVWRCLRGLSFPASEDTASDVIMDVRPGVDANDNVGMKKAGPCVREAERSKIQNTKLRLSCAVHLLSSASLAALAPATFVILHILVERVKTRVVRWQNFALHFIERLLTALPFHQLEDTNLFCASFL